MSNKTTDEEKKTIEDIEADLGNHLATAPLPPSGGVMTPIPPETYAQIQARARKDAEQDYNVESAKLDFAASSAWAIAGFGIAMIALVAWLGFRRVLQPSKLIALGLIVTSALLLIVLGYTDEQMSPVIGLLGTIAGYMLGSKEWDRADATTTAAADAADAAEQAKKARLAAEKAAAATQES